MFDKVSFIIKNKLLNLDNQDLIFKIYDKNPLIRELAKEELCSRDLTDLKLPEPVLEQVINKLTVEQIWFLVKSGQKNNFVRLAMIKLNMILDYYQKLNIEDFLVKKNEDKIKIL